jgi:hypothetical protein
MNDNTHPVIAMDGICRRFGNVVALDGLTFRVFAGLVDAGLLWLGGRVFRRCEMATRLQGQCLGGGGGSRKVISRAAPTLPSAQRLPCRRNAISQAAPTSPARGVRRDV